MKQLPSQPTIGLVLAGGGAKGAYQVGALRYLAEQGFEPTVIAGTSIGALNGALLAAYPQSLEVGVAHLQKVWRAIGKAEVPAANPHWWATLAAYGMQVALRDVSPWLIRLLEVTGILPQCRSFFDPRPIEEIIRHEVDYQRIKYGRELWITVFPSFQLPFLRNPLLQPLIDQSRAWFGTQADWLRAQDCPDAETFTNLLLASAAVPYLFPHREVKGQVYVNGALADNVPLRALARRGCTHAIVIHLEDGFHGWSRYEFPEMQIIEIRPQRLLNESNTVIVGDIQSLLDFRPERLQALEAQGYADAQYIIEDIFGLLNSLERCHEQHRRLEESTRRLQQRSDRLQANTEQLRRFLESKDPQN